MDNESVQEVGIIYSKEAAESVYGAVKEHVGLNSSVFASIVEKSNHYVMFSIRDGVIIIADENRNPLHPEGAEFSEDLVFHYFSRSKVLELIKMGSESEISIELRRDVLSITNGNFTLENARPCPPYCPS